MQTGNIGVTTENIFPVIKKFLYSDHDIFLREIVSNAVDASQKVRTLANNGELKEELGDLTIQVKIDKDTGCLVVSDHGIGMTEEEIDKYINQIAFSGANDFLDKYKDDTTAIIGHFGLGFYSSFMVSKKVEIVTKSYQEGSKAVKWSCDGSPSYTIEEVDRTERGTDILMYLDDDCQEFLEESKVSELLRKYCQFLPIPIAFGKEKEWKEGKQVETDTDHIINDTTPLWTKKPADLKDEDYQAFYRKLYPMSDEPLFWIHLNVDYPFHLTGVLYFPKVKSSLELQKNKIQLYCNQVFVTDSVEGIVPEYLTLLHGVIDSPDIPLNVSRSYLQSDSNVKKISGYISKKVSDRLQSIFKNDRKDFEAKWDDLKVFIHFGMLTEEDFYDRGKKFALFKDTEGKYFTYEEYEQLIKDAQTDKDGTLVYLYATDKEGQYNYIESAKNKGYSVLLLDGQLDSALLGLLEQKMEKSRFTRVDSDVLSRLIPKDESATASLDAKDKELLEMSFKSQMPSIEKVEFHVEAQSLGSEELPLVMTQSEYMRRMKEVSQLQPGMSFYGEMPDMMNLVVNSDHSLVQKVLEEVKSQTTATLDPIRTSLDELEARRTQLNEQTKGKKWDEVDQQIKDDLSATEKAIDETKQQQTDIVSKASEGNTIIHELIDLSLLENGLLKGESLTAFVKRSIELMK